MQGKRGETSHISKTPSPQTYDLSRRPGDLVKMSVNYRSEYNTLAMAQRKTRWSRSEDYQKSVLSKSASPGAVYTLPDLWGSKNSYHIAPKYVPSTINTRTSTNKTTNTTTKTTITLTNSSAMSTVKRSTTKNPIDELDLSPNTIDKVKKMSTRQVKQFIEMKKLLRNKKLNDVLGMYTKQSL